MQSCCLVGDSTLLIKCGEILLENSLTINAIVTQEAKVINWAEKQQICYFETPEELINHRVCVDYLFSIVNYRILPKKILDVAKILPINYHDSLLPQYAGANATTWTIINQEKQHGVTWHVMSENVDQGDILQQGKITIEPNETALTLNLKCYAKAIETFNSLVSKLLNNNCEPKKQVNLRRSYFSINKPLPNCGFINWYQNAEYIDRIFRAVSYGDYENRVGMLKVIIKNKIYLVGQLVILSKPHTADV